MPHLSLNDLVHESVDVFGRKGVLEAGHLVHAAAQGPDVRLVVVGLVCKQLWAHVVRRPDDSVCKVTRSIQYTGDTKVSHLRMKILKKGGGGIFKKLRGRLGKLFTLMISFLLRKMF